MNTQEMTRTREQGTNVTKPTNGLERIAAVRDIVAQSQYAKVDGIMLDLFSASAIVTVYDALNETNQAKYREFPVSKMASIAFKFVA